MTLSGPMETLIPPPSVGDKPSQPSQPSPSLKNTGFSSDGSRDDVPSTTATVTGSPTLPELMETLEGQGVKLSLRLRVDAPKGVMTDQLMADLNTCKPLLLARLGKEAEWKYLSAQRSGPALNDPIPETDADDSCAVEERLAIENDEAEYF